MQHSSLFRATLFAAVVVFVPANTLAQERRGPTLGEVHLCNGQTDRTLCLLALETKHYDASRFRFEPVLVDASPMFDALGFTAERAIAALDSNELGKALAFDLVATRAAWLSLSLERNGETPERALRPLLTMYANDTSLPQRQYFEADKNSVLEGRLRAYGRIWNVIGPKAPIRLKNGVSDTYLRALLAQWERDVVAASRTRLADFDTPRGWGDAIDLAQAYMDEGDHAATARVIPLIGRDKSALLTGHVLLQDWAAIARLAESMELRRAQRSDAEDGAIQFQNEALSAIPRGDPSQMKVAYSILRSIARSRDPERNSWGWFSMAPAGGAMTMVADDPDGTKAIAAATALEPLGKAHTRSDVGGDFSAPAAALTAFWLRMGQRDRAIAIENAWAPTAHAALNRGLTGIASMPPPDDPRVFEQWMTDEYVRRTYGQILLALGREEEAVAIGALEVRDVISWNIMQGQGKDAYANAAARFPNGPDIQLSLLTCASGFYTDDGFRYPTFAYSASAPTLEVGEFCALELMRRAETSEKRGQAARAAISVAAAAARRGKVDLSHRLLNSVIGVVELGVDEQSRSADVGRDLAPLVAAELRREGRI